MFKKLMLSTAVLSMIACGGAGATDDAETLSVGDRLQAINLNPKDATEAEKSIGQIDALLDETNQDPKVLAALHTLDDSLDAMNGLVSVLNVGVRKVRFYHSADGSVTIRDSGPLNTESIIRSSKFKDLSTVDLFRALAPNTEVPRELTQTPELSADVADALAPAAKGPATSGVPSVPGQENSDIGSTQQALTGSDSDALWFSLNRCPRGGVEPYCFPQSAGNGSWASFGNFRYSEFNIAPYKGSQSVKQTTNGTVSTHTVRAGEDDQFSSRGPNISVQDSGCCFICACGTHPDVKKVWHSWEILLASGDEFHWGGNWHN